MWYRRWTKFEDPSYLLDPDMAAPERSECGTFSGRRSFIGEAEWQIVRTEERAIRARIGVAIFIPGVCLVFSLWFV